EDQEFAHGEPRAGDRADDTLPVPVAVVSRAARPCDCAMSAAAGFRALRRARGSPGSRFDRAPFLLGKARWTTGHKPPVNGGAMESQELRRAGLKVTHPRMRILELLEQK